MLRKSKGNMYDFVTHTWNPIKGKCRHDCKYCYMKKWKQLPLRLDENEMQTDLGWGNYIFVGSSTDMFAEDVPAEWICRVFDICILFNNTYLFQSKNPKRFSEFEGLFPSGTILGTTIESNRNYPELSKAPSIESRVDAMIDIKETIHRIMITIEPVLNFDVNELVGIIKDIEPDWVNIGADSCGHNLPEPSKKKLLELIDKIEIHQKTNLGRLLK